jgi:ADP-ribosylation factor protein 6
MGGTLSFTNLLNRLFATQKPVSVLMLGLDSVGKTTILYKLKLNEAI